ncbi:MAG: ABC transporter ATP-binding protein [Arcobacter sp.]|nr:MAG: ABC transporter ATP-binding protein [Arcobacter sp.]
MKIVLSVKNITKIYKKYNSNFDRLKEVFFKTTHHKEFISNQDISFDLYEGETLGIIGVNGAGKSTILKIIAGITSPTSGQIIRKGRVTALLELGTGFNNDMSGFDNIYLNARLIGMSKEQIDKNLQSIIDFSELGEYIYENIKTYSSGMRMRLAFSIALFSEPKILIVDEALSVGDAHFSAKCTKALKKRKEQKMSIIYVSHDLNSLKLLCDRVILLNHGKVIKEDTPQNTINSYNYLISKLNDKDGLFDLKNENTKSFGTLDVEITDVSLKGSLSNTNTIISGELVTISVQMKSKLKLKDMTIGMMIRDKFGQDVFGTNTFYHDVKIVFEENKNYLCTFEMPMNVGNGQYTISMAIHSKDTHLEYCAHWFESAESFSVIGIEGNLGICKLNPTINFVEKIV